MSRARHALVAVGLCAAVGVIAMSTRAQAAGADIHVDKKTRLDHEVLVRGFAPHDGSCRPMRLPGITVTGPPANGDVEQRPGKVKTAANWVGDTSCEGTVYDGVQVWYRPHPGFTGSDHFTMQVDYPGKLGRVEADVSIEVVPQASVAPPAASTAASTASAP